MSSQRVCFGNVSSARAYRSFGDWIPSTPERRARGVDSTGGLPDANNTRALARNTHVAPCARVHRVGWPSCGLLCPFSPPM